VEQRPGRGVGVPGQLVNSKTRTSRKKEERKGRREGGRKIGQFSMQKQWTMNVLGVEHRSYG
jgi:hypothetical protein